MGPIKLEVRLDALKRILKIQETVNREADARRRPRVDLLNDEERARIEALIAAGTWPQKWTGDEPGAEEDFEEHFADGSSQPLLFAMGAR